MNFYQFKNKHNFLSLEKAKVVILFFQQQPEFIREAS